MPFIHINKTKNEYRLFGSLPILARTFKIKLSKLTYVFSIKKDNIYETENTKVVRVKLERGGSKNKQNK